MGQKHFVSCWMFQVGAWLDFYRTHSGREFMDQHKMHYTDYASIQVLDTIYEHPICWLLICINTGTWLYMKMDRLRSRSAACLVSGLLESSHARRPTASHRRVSSPSFVGGQKYCKNIERHLLSILLMSETFRNIIHVRQYIQKAPSNLSF